MVYFHEKFYMKRNEATKMNSAVKRFMRNPSKFGTCGQDSRIIDVAWTIYQYKALNIEVQTLFCFDKIGLF